MAKNFKVMASNAKESDGKCVPKSMRKSVESACGKKSVKAGAELVRENEVEIVLKDDDGAQLRVVKRPYGYRIRRSMNEAENGEFAWDISKEIYDTPEEAKQAALDGTATFTFKGRKYASPIGESCNKKSVKSSKSVKKFGIKASKAAKKRVAAAKGYWADDINAENYRKILKALDDYLTANYDGKTIGDVEIGVSELRSIKDGKGSKIEVEFYSPDYEKDTKLEIISAPDLRSKFLCRVSVDPFKFDEELEIPQSGSKQIVVDKINEIANKLSSSAVESSCKTKKTVKASAAAKKRKAQQRIMAAESNGLERAKQYIVDAYNNENWDSEDMTVDEYFKNEDLHKVGLVYTTLGDNDEYDYQISVDLIDPKVIVEIDGKLVYEDSYSGIDALADDLADFNWDDWYSYYIHKLPKEYDDIFSSIKKSVNVKITASDNYYDEDIVFYFNGKKQFEGSIFDLADTVEILCHDPKVMQVFQDYCNQFGDPIDFDGTPRDTAVTFTKMVMFEAEEANEPSDFYVEYSDYRNPTGGFEIFYANEGIYSAKSIKCRDNGNDVWEYQESYDDYYDEIDVPENVQRLGDLSEQLRLNWFAKFAELHPDENTYDRESWPDVDEAVGYTLDEATYSPEKIKASTDIKVANSLNLNAKPNYTDWMLRGYKFDGEDVTTLRIDFQDDVKQAVMDMFADPDIETVDLYKIPTEQETTGVFEDEEYFKTFTREDINSSVDIEAGITVGEDSRFDFSNPIYELDDYVKAIADGVVNRIQGITYDISKETIAFFDKDNNVVFVQPIGGIIPEPDDLETDIDELSAAIQSEMDNAYGRENWEQDEDDPDYASRTIELSEDIGEVDIDDLEPITGDDEDIDYGFGFDSNGDAIDESTVEELYRIAEYEILPKSELAKIDEYVSIDEDSWDFYMSSPFVTEKFYIHFKLTEKDINFNDYALPDGKMFPDFNYYTAVLDFDIYAENGEITSVILEDKKIYRPDGAFDDYDVKQFDDLYNVEALINYVEHLAADAVKDIYNGTTNL